MNIELMQQVINQIEAHPKEWDQGTWGRKSACGTTMCFAGWAAHLSGFKLVWAQRVTDPFADALAVEADGNRRDIFDAARDLLGLNEAQAKELFFSSEHDTLPIARNMIKEAQ